MGDSLQLFAFILLAVFLSPVAQAGSNSSSCKSGDRVSCKKERNDDDEWTGNYICYHDDKRIDVYPQNMSSYCYSKLMEAKAATDLRNAEPDPIKIAVGNATKIIDAKSAAAPQGQTHAQTSLLEISSTGASHAATVAAIICAEGANQAAAGNDAEAADKVGACDQAFKAAEGMKTMEVKAAENNGVKAEEGFKRENEFLSSDHAKDTLQKFEKNFNVSPDDYLNKMLRTGRSAEMEDLIKPRLGEAKVAAILEKVEPLPQNEVNLAAKPDSAAKKKPGDGMRSSLQSALANRAPASISAGNGKANSGTIAESLTPLDKSVFFGAEEAAVELTIFDVVHRRYEIIVNRFSK